MSRERLPRSRDCFERARKNMVAWLPQHRPKIVNGFCHTCGLPASKHRIDERTAIERTPYRQHRRVILRTLKPAVIPVPPEDAESLARAPKRKPRSHGRKKRKHERIIGIDGEGQGRAPHRYTYLAATDEKGETWELRNDDPTQRLTTVQCLDFLLSLPQPSLIVGYGFTYDLTKILQDLDDRSLGLLFHEDRRSLIVCKRCEKTLSKPRPECPNHTEATQKTYPVIWNGYRLNYLNRCFTVSRSKHQRATVWDVFRFFQNSFVGSLTDWEIATPTELKRMTEMKANRAKFDRLLASGEITHADIQRYCREECGYLSTLYRANLTAHTEAGLTLATHFGAGSTASALLNKLRIKEYRAEPPAAMKSAVACAFVGGRFENSVIGAFGNSTWDPVYNFDISSAYPYHLAFLPCLTHGRWRFVTDERELDGKHVRLACVHWTLPRSIMKIPQAFGPLPVRAENGTIQFPLCAPGGGWCWNEEFRAAQRFNPGVRFDNAWVYETDCGCRPFAELANIYRERCKLGKEARGKILKLGPNAVFGKTAQSKGFNPPFQSWVWAGAITSGCRGQLLDMMRGAREPWSIKMLATDGVYATEDLPRPKPRDTGTSDLPKPLGGWERYPYPDGMFAVRPGIYFPINPSEDELKAVRARGLGKKILYDQHEKIMESYHAGQLEHTITGIERFVGAKSGVHIVTSKDGDAKKARFVRSTDLGDWVDYPIKVSFHPMPKRTGIEPGGRLTPIAGVPWASAPYDPAMSDPELEAMRRQSLFLMEQPDASYVEGDCDDLL